MTLLEFYDVAGQKLQPMSAIESGSVSGDIDGSRGATGLIFHGETWGGRADPSGQFWVGGDWGNVAVAVSYVLLSQRGPNHRKSLGTIE